MTPKRKQGTPIQTRFLINPDRYQARHRHKLCRNRQTLPYADIIRCFLRGEFGKAVMAGGTFLTGLTGIARQRLHPPRTHDAQCGNPENQPDGK